MIKIVYDLMFYKHKLELSTSNFGSIYNPFYNLVQQNNILKKALLMISIFIKKQSQMVFYSTDS